MATRAKRPRTGKVKANVKAKVRTRVKDGVIKTSRKIGKMPTSTELQKLDPAASEPMMPGLFEFDIDGPPFTRAAVRFANWSRPGLVISGDKLGQDIGMLRSAAKYLRTVPDAEATRLAEAFMTLATQYELARLGRHPQAVAPKPDEPPPSTDNYEPADG